MQKLLVNCLHNDDVNFFSWHPEQFQIVYHDNIKNLFNSDGIILLTRDILKKYGKIQTDNRYVISMLQEGSNTVVDFLNRIGWSDQGTWPFILSSGNLPDEIAHFNVDIFRYILGNTTEQLHNRDNEFCNNIFKKTVKPFAFNFLNGIERPHRKYLIEKLQECNLLSKALWSALYDNKFLPDNYCYQVNKDTVVNGKYIFHDWPDGQLFGNLYEDTYFSVVAETNFYLPHSFRTEKIYRSLKIGHPFIAAANYGFYRDLHSMGFKTFGHLIDESFDLIDDNEKRLDRIVQVIEDLCQSDLSAFLLESENICRHNRDLLMSTSKPQEDLNLLEKFFEKYNKYAKNKQ